MDRMRSRGALALVALVVAVTALVVLAVAAHASPASTTKCTLTADPESCVNISGAGLHVDTVTAGAYASHTESWYGAFKVGKVGPGVPMSGIVVIHTSTFKVWYFSPAYTWGPTYTQDQWYPDGTRLCAWFTAWFDVKACGTIHE